MEYRIYLIKELGNDGTQDNKIRLVRAGSKAQVLRHLVKDRFSIENPSTADVGDYVEAGVPIERVANNDNADAI
jgi:hypothetical protein